MPAVFELEHRASWPLRATTRQLHGLACAVFEGGDAGDHAGQEKAFSVWPTMVIPAQTCAGPEPCAGSDLLPYAHRLVLIRLACLFMVRVFGWRRC